MVSTFSFGDLPGEGRRSKSIALAWADMVERPNPHHIHAMGPVVLVSQQVLCGLAQGIRVLRRKGAKLVDWSTLRRRRSVDLRRAHEKDSRLPVEILHRFERIDYA